MRSTTLWATVLGAAMLSMSVSPGALAAQSTAPEPANVVRSAASEQANVTAVADPVRHEAEAATIPTGSKVVVKSESGTSGGSYVELTREIGEQRNSILVFEDALSVPEPGIYQVDIGYKTVAGDYKKQLLKIIEPLDEYVVEEKNLKGAQVVAETVGEFQSSVWGKKSYTFKVNKAGTFDFQIQGDWGFQDIDYVDVYPGKVAVDATIGISSYIFYTSSPEDLAFKYENNYQAFVGLTANGVGVDHALYTIDEVAKEITISRDFFLGTNAETGTVRVVFEAGNPAEFTYTIFDKVPKKSLYQAEDGALLATSKVEFDEASGTTYVTTEGTGGVQWKVDAPKDGRYRLNLRYRATTGDQVQNVVVKNQSGELFYGTGMPITPFEVSDQNSRDGWEVVTQKVELKAGINTIENSGGKTHLDYMQIGEDADRSLPFTEQATISPSRESYYQNDPRDLHIHLEKNGNELASIKTVEGRKLTFSVDEFDTADLDSGYKSNKRDILLPSSQMSSLHLGQNQLTLKFTGGARLTYTVNVRKFVERGELQIVSFDVGHGNATLFRLPNGKNLLIDSGKPEQADAMVLPYLKKHRLTVDYYLATHFHDDHTGRLEQILAENGLARISKQRAIELVGGDDTTRVEVLRNFQYLDNTMLVPGDNLENIWDLGGVNMQILNSRYDMQGHEVPDLDENNTSVAAMVQYKGFKYLHQADIYAKTENEMLARFGAEPSFWDVDYLQGNHHFHGSVSPTFLRLTNPELVYVQVSGAVFSRGAYSTLYQTFVEEYLRENSKDLVDTVLAPESGSLVLDINSVDDWYYMTHKDLASADTVGRQSAEPTTLR